MNLGSIVVYGWKYLEEPYHSMPEKIGIIVGHPKFSENVVGETLFKEADEWSMDFEKGLECVDVMWENGLVEECAMENLFEVKTCQTGI